MYSIYLVLLYTNSTCVREIPLPRKCIAETITINKNGTSDKYIILLYKMHISLHAMCVCELFLTPVCGNLKKKTYKKYIYLWYKTVKMSVLYKRKYKE